MFQGITSPWSWMLFVQSLVPDAEGVKGNIHGESQQQPRKLRGCHEPVKDLGLLSKVLYNKHSSQPTKRGWDGCTSRRFHLSDNRPNSAAVNGLIVPAATMISRMLSGELYGETATKVGLKYLGHKSTSELKKVTMTMAAARTNKILGQIQAGIIDLAVQGHNGTGRTGQIKDHDPSRSSI
ncbi:hypothetical protein QBC33DRAFT_13084 [Phialemonium atrogriseum]|uniref:Uncharacterized protein n=1 Tax=Phialemonium atrogriseum TaxID=1093897 RepID=A0AAJ0FLD4_9PEZI|nr:uncharacterized protein QBC33DRAFT_13084 [Phialemonium atrogriseum]KAK1772511.1 hypothetical protein QBC33DRAFT_13084 [Phialemonium atrogriseum]